MPRQTLNLGILAHVDAGKTTLTERLLYAAGVIDEIGSVDAGTTQTDSLALERQRGITIKSAVASFAVGGVTVNLIDTPGHPDFIAEVERVLSVLDGAVLVISAVEGVQPQTRVLMRALGRLRIPALLFVNKIDRAGAGEERVLRAISARLSPAVVPMGSASGLGTRAAGFTPWGEADAGARARLAEILAERDEGILASYIDDELGLPYARLRQELAAQARRALVYPVFFGSAVTGAGVPALMAGLAELLPAGTGDVGGPVSGRVFKIERGQGGEKLAYVRMFSGTVRTRDRRVALGQLAEQDPLINVRQSPGELAVSLYGEVQKEVIQATLAADFGIEVTFRETTTICVERPVGSGQAAELLGAPGNPFPAALGLRVDPAPPGSGVAFRLEVDIRSVPMYVYKTVGNFTAMMTRYVTLALREGLRGWQVTDCTVTMLDCAYISPSTTAAHFRKLTPLVLMAALDQAGTAVCEPMIRVSLEIPAETVGSVLAAVARLGGTAGTPVLRADLAAVPTLLPAARAQDLQRQLPGLTSGEGVAETGFGGYRPVTGRPPARRRTLADPRNREEYMLQLAGRATAAPAKQAQSSDGR